MKSRGSSCHSCHEEDHSALECPKFLRKQGERRLKIRSVTFHLIPVSFCSGRSRQRRRRAWRRLLQLRPAGASLPRLRARISGRMTGSSAKTRALDSGKQLANRQRRRTIVARSGGDCRGAPLPVAASTAIAGRLTIGARTNLSTFHQKFKYFAWDLSIIFRSSVLRVFNV